MIDVVYTYVYFYSAYVDRLVMPKLVIHAGGDEFFLPDDSYYFWDALQGEKYIRYVFLFICYETNGLVQEDNQHQMTK